MSLLDLIVRNKNSPQFVMVLLPPAKRKKKKKNNKKSGELHILIKGVLRIERTYSSACPHQQVHEHVPKDTELVF